MINDSAIIKYFRSHGHTTDWPERTVLLKNRIRDIKLGFPGLGNDHLSLVPYKTIKDGDLFIWDVWLLELRYGDEAPIMFRKISDNEALIEGIGVGIDSKRDPDRTRLRWMDTISLPIIDPEILVLRVDVRPTINGGPGYYYFFKAYRDWRY